MAPFHSGWSGADGIYYQAKLPFMSKYAVKKVRNILSNVDIEYLDRLLDNIRSPIVL